MKEPIRVLVTGAAGQIGYSLVYMIGSGNVFGSDQPIILHLLDIPPVMGVLNGVTMELQDCALPLLHDIIATDKEEIAFANIDAAFLVGAMPRKEGMERSDLLGCNAKIFKSQGAALDKHAKKTVKVLVVGNPANTNALICSKHAPSIPQENFCAMIRLDENRMRGLLSMRLHVTVPDIKNCIVWGNHSTTMFPDVSHGSVTIDGKEKALKEAINDDKWLKEEFVPTIQKRGAQVIAARKLSSAMSAAKAAGDHMRDWWYGTKEGHWVCMSVCSKGEYGVDKGLFFGFPCTVKNGEWKVVEGLTLDDYAKHMIEHTKTELLTERDLALK